MSAPAKLLERRLVVILVDCKGHLYSYAIRRDGSAYDHRTGLASSL